MSKALIFEDGTVLPIYNSLDEAFPYLPHSNSNHIEEPQQTAPEEEPTPTETFVPEV